MYKHDLNYIEHTESELMILKSTAVFPVPGAPDMYMLPEV